MLYDDVFRLTKTFFSNVDCGTCNNYPNNKSACDYCSNKDQHNLLWNVNDNLAHNFVSEVIKVVKEYETDI